MTPKLTDEQRAALLKRGAPVAVEDEKTHQMYFLVDPAMLEALEMEADVAAIRRGVADAEVGRTLPLDEAIRQIETDLRAHAHG
jgi:predicted transcriptional regulator